MDIISEIEMVSLQIYCWTHFFLYVCPEIIYAETSIYVYSLKYQHIRWHSDIQIYFFKMDFMENTFLQLKKISLNE